MKIVIIFFILLFIVPISLNFSINFDFIANRGEIFVSIFKLKITYVKCLIKDGYIYLINRSKKQIRLPINSQDEDLKTYTQGNIIILRKIDLKKIETILTLGIEDNAFSTSIFAGFMLAIFNSVFSFLSQLKERCLFYVDAIPVYQQNKLQISLNTTFSVSIFDYIWGKLELKLITLKGDNLKWKKQKATTD